MLESDDVGVALVAKNKLQALSVVTSAQGHGVGSALMRRLQPEWVSAIADRISFFERLGYKSFGAPKVGQNGKHATQLMQRGESTEDTVTADAATAARAPSKKEEAAPITRLMDLLDETEENRSIAHIQIMDDMMQRAIAAEKFEAVLKIVDEARGRFLRLDTIRRNK